MADAKNETGLDHCQVRLYRAWYRHVTHRRRDRRLFCLYSRTARPETFHEHWSPWRRRHQATARQCHYTRRTGNLNLSLEH